MQQQSQNHLVKKKKKETHKPSDFNTKELSEKKFKYSFFESHKEKLGHEILEKYISNSAFFSRISKFTYLIETFIF